MQIDRCSLVKLAMTRAGTADGVTGKKKRFSIQLLTDFSATIVKST